jgi:hypothetical protein
MNTPKQEAEWKKEFDKHVQDLQDLWPEKESESPYTYFGMKILRDGGIFTATDWGHVRKFIEDIIQQQQQRLIQRLEKEKCHALSMSDGISEYNKAIDKAISIIKEDSI